MAKLCVLDRTGHGTVAEWQKDDATAVAAAEAFDRLKTTCLMVDTAGNNGEGAQMRSFDPAVEEILAIPGLEGG